MNTFFKTNKSLVTYSLILFIITFFFGFNFLINLIGNILLLIFLIPLLLLLIAFIGFNSFKSKFNTCDNCGTISLGLSNTCTTCGAEFKKDNQDYDDASQSTIEVKAEEIK